MKIDIELEIGPLEAVDAESAQEGRFEWLDDEAVPSEFAQVTDQSSQGLQVHALSEPFWKSSAKFAAKP